MTVRATVGRRRTVLAVLVVVGLGPGSPAAAHTRLTATSPAAGATVPATTDELVLSFSSPVRADLARVSVTGPDGAAASGAVTGSGADVVQRLRTPLSAGAWTAAYRVVSPDGHPISGTVAFTVAPAAPSAGTAGLSQTPSPPTGEPSPAPAADAQGATDDDPSALSVALGVLVLGAVGASVVVLRRRRSTSTGTRS